MNYDRTKKQALDKAARGLQWSQGSMFVEKEGKTVKSEGKRLYRENSQQVLEAVLDMLRIDMQNTIEDKDVAEHMVHYQMSNEEIKHESENLLEWIESRWEIDENSNLIKND